MYLPQSRISGTKIVGNHILKINDEWRDVLYYCQSDVSRKYKGSDAGR